MIGEAGGGFFFAGWMAACVACGMPDEWSLALRVPLSMGIYLVGWYTVQALGG